ncbi:hypothetical protein BB559_003438 [Furculomyces boomerangus]|uniref:Uncharacterized protein n=1 Tax=Furculomyces boomerangus TaxID=61424 RepID=A0A2T9YL87_9FUNG|nr:hypothetical protein BB559_003438 [Furculomyces boomerangus]
MQTIRHKINNNEIFDEAIPMRKIKLPEYAALSKTQESGKIYGGRKNEYNSNGNFSHELKNKKSIDFKDKASIITGNIGGASKDIDRKKTLLERSNSISTDTMQTNNKEFQNQFQSKTLLDRHQLHSHSSSTIVSQSALSKMINKLPRKLWSVKVVPSGSAKSFSKIKKTKSESYIYKNTEPNKYIFENHKSIKTKSGTKNAKAKVSETPMENILSIRDSIVVRQNRDTINETIVENKNDSKIFHSYSSKTYGNRDTISSYKPETSNRLSKHWPLPTQAKLSYPSEASLKNTSECSNNNIEDAEFLKVIEFENIKLDNIYISSPSVADVYNDYIALKEVHSETQEEKHNSINDSMYLLELTDSMIFCDYGELKSMNPNYSVTFGCRSNNLLSENEKTIEKHQFSESVVSLINSNDSSLNLNISAENLKLYKEFKTDSLDKNVKKVTKIIQKSELSKPIESMKILGTNDKKIDSEDPENTNISSKTEINNTGNVFDGSDKRFVFNKPIQKPEPLIVRGDSGVEVSNQRNSQKRTKLYRNSNRKNEPVVRPKAIYIVEPIPNTNKKTEFSLRTSVLYTLDDDNDPKMTKENTLLNSMHNSLLLAYKFCLSN